MLTIKLTENPINWKLVTNLNGDTLESVFDKDHIYPQFKNGFVISRVQADSLGTHFTIINILIQYLNLDLPNIHIYMEDYIKEEFPTAIVEYTSYVI